MKQSFKKGNITLFTSETRNVIDAQRCYIYSYICNRIVIYTSIDLQGVKQRVVETDKTQKDCIHVENSSGIFAHREYTQQEQTEDIDDEQVTFIRASEEYVHLKREDDEYEYVHSEIPPTETMQDDDRNDENNDSDSSLETKRKGF
jgi:hypothetical protein